MTTSNGALIFVGSLNRAVPHFETANGSGITTLRLDETTGKLSLLATLGGMDNPTYLAPLPARGVLYATSEVFGDAEGSIGAWRFDAQTGTLAPLGERRATRGSLSVFCTTDRAGRHAFVANYAHEARDETPGFHVASFPLHDDGTLLPARNAYRHDGHGPHADRQSVPHAHCIAPSPDNRFALVTDLGADTVSVYRIDTQGGGLLPPLREPLRLPAGSGPRHLAFHPSLPGVYVVNELNNTLSRLAYARENGGVALEQTIAALPDGLAGSHAADLAVSNDGRFLYVSFRGADCIGVYALADDGALAQRRGIHPSGGRTPRSFTLSPSNRFLLVANQDSDQLAVWRIDARSGALLDLADEARVGTPMCVKALA